MKQIRKFGESVAILHIHFLNNLEQMVKELTNTLTRCCFLLHQSSAAFDDHDAELVSILPE